ncbi:MAG TPA: histidine-type phosphatase [Rhizomicrobium sp.]
MRTPVAALLLLGAFAAPAAAAPVLEKVVILQRHGVRAPTKAPSDLAPYARDAWASWPVAPGELTEHGAAALARMGEALHRQYAALLPAGDCRRVFVWADNADQRTRRSGEVMAQALGCPGAAQWAKGGNDPLFHGDDICPADPGAAKAAVTARLDAVLAAHRPAYDKARRALAGILTPGLSSADCADDKKCVLLADRNTVKDGGKLSGTLADGSTLSENLFLEYAEGKENPGWGRMDAAALAAIMPLHNMASDLGRRTPIMAAHNANLLARQIAALLADNASLRIAVPDGARLILLAGHDTNLSNIAAMLGLDWSLPGEPDATAPDTALAFEKWHDGKRGDFVGVRLYYQTALQLRTAAVLSKLPRRDLALPECGAACTPARISALMESAMARECLEPSGVR